MLPFLKNTIAFLVIFHCLNSHAKEVVVDDTKEDYLVPANCIEVFVDSTGLLTFDEVLKYNKFKVDKDPFPHITNFNHTYWLKFSIYNREETQKRWVIEALDPHFTNMNFYRPNDNGDYSVLETGIEGDFYKREYSHKNFIFDVTLNPKTKTTFYFRLKSNNHNVFLFKLRTTRFFTKYALNEYWILGLYYGILFIMGLYNLLLFFTIRESFYLYYVVYVISCALLSFAEDGIGFQYIWPSISGLNPFITFYTPLLFLWCFTLYAKSFLELKTRMPSVNRLIDLFIAIYSIYFILDLKWFNLSWNIPAYAIPYLFMYIVAVRLWVEGYRPARFFVIGYSTILISIIMLILRMNGKVEWDNIFTIYSFNIGIVVEIVILSIALGDKIRIMKLEKEQMQLRVIEQLQENEKLKDKVNQELEQKIQERTREISDQKEIIEEQNKELSFANEKLLEQAQHISKINTLLSEENQHLSIEKNELTLQKEGLIEEKNELEINVKELNKARVFMKDVDFSEFGRIFPDKDSCMNYLVELKWSKGYSCIKCKNTKYFDGHEPYARRCTRCGHEESATAYTIFHRLRFPINKAFYMLFLIYSNKGKITTLELSEIITLRQSTCWSFRKKVQEKMETKRKNTNAESDGWSWLVLEGGEK